MSSEYLFKCGDCGFMWDPDQSKDLNQCERCGSTNRQHVIQEEGRFGCTSKRNTHVQDISAKGVED